MERSPPRLDVSASARLRGHRRPALSNLRLWRWASRCLSSGFRERQPQRARLDLESAGRESGGTGWRAGKEGKAGGDTAVFETADVPAQWRAHGNDAGGGIARVVRKTANLEEIDVD